MKAPFISEDVLSIHREAIVVDLHVDVILQQRLFGYDISKKHNPFMRRQPFIWQADIPRMLEGGYTLATLGIHYFPWESKKAWKEVLQQLDYIKKVANNDSRVVIISNADDIIDAKKNNKLAVIAGLEGAHLLGGDLNKLEELHSHSILYLTLTHFSQNTFATPGLGKGQNKQTPLSSEGKKLIEKLNQLKILADLAHLNERGVLDACSYSSAPVIASHSCAKGYHQNLRGITDEGLKAIAKTNGVVGVIFAPNFLCGRLNAPVRIVAEQMAYIADLIGTEHVAFGSDFDGWIPTIPNDMRDCRDMPLLTKELLALGMSHSEIIAILGGNVLRVLRTIRG